MLGYEFPRESFLRAFEHEIHGIVIDAGSTDAGPHKLGASVSIVSKREVKKDLELMLKKSLSNKIPIIIGSAGGAGARKHVEDTLDILNEIIDENNYSPKTTIIWADFEQESIINSINSNRIKPLSKNIPSLTEDSVK